MSHGARATGPCVAFNRLPSKCKMAYQHPALTSLGVRSSRKTRLATPIIPLQLKHSCGHDSASRRRDSAGRRTQVVRERSAKPRCIGSNPIAASTKPLIYSIFGSPSEKGGTVAFPTWARSWPGENSPSQLAGNLETNTQRHRLAMPRQGTGARPRHKATNRAEEV